MSYPNGWRFRLFDPSTFVMPKRTVTRVFLHCSDSDVVTQTGGYRLEGVNLAEEINRWHAEPPPQGNGWAGIGYHFVVDKAGGIATGRDLELTPAAQLGAAPLVPASMIGQCNIATIAICTHGQREWTTEAMKATHDLCVAIDAAYFAAGRPVTFWPHHAVDPRPCPVYHMEELLGLDTTRRLHAVPPVEAAIVAKESTTVWPKLAMTDPLHHGSS